MNREEAIYFANCLKNNYTVDLNDMEAFCDMAIKALEQEPKSEWEHDHEILRAYSDGANEALDNIRAEIETVIGEHKLDDYDFCSGLIVARKLIDKYKGESEKA